MYRTPSGRRAKKTVPKLNLIPILDAVFIFIFFLLLSANFMTIFEINSDVPLVSSKPPKEKKKPLALTLKIDNKGFVLTAGVPARLLKRIPKVTVDNEDKYDYESLHQFLVSIKQDNKEEETIIFEPLTDITYEELVEIMDAVRMLKNTDESIFVQQEGVDVKIESLFSNIVFGNLMS